jgi:hypothetical protein
MEGMQQCTSLLLPQNRLSGTLPAGAGLMPRLRFLDLSSNAFRSATAFAQSFVERFSMYVCLSIIYCLSSCRARSGTLPDSLDAVRHTIEDMNLGGNDFEARIPTHLCDLQAGDICRGGGMCEKSMCACIDGVVGKFCEFVSEEDIEQLKFTGRKWFDTSVYGACWQCRLSDFVAAVSVLRATVNLAA